MLLSELIRQISLVGLLVPVPYQFLSQRGRIKVWKGGGQTDKREERKGKISYEVA